MIAQTKNLQINPNPALYEIIPYKMTMLAVEVCSARLGQYQSL